MSWDHAVLGGWGDDLLGEKAYIVLGLSAKSLLARRVFSAVPGADRGLRRQDMQSERRGTR